MEYSRSELFLVSKVKHGHTLRRSLIIHLSDIVGGGGGAHKTHRLLSLFNSYDKMQGASKADGDGNFLKFSRNRTEARSMSV